MKFKIEGSTDSKNYLRLKDKDSVKGLFVGDPYEFRTHWAGQSSHLCSEDNNCERCASGEKSTFRFRQNFIVKNETSYESKILEQGWTVYCTLKGLHEGEYDLEKHLMVISRVGSGKNDTTYSIVPAKNGEVTPTLAATLAKVPLIELRHKEEFLEAPVKPHKDFVPEPAFDNDEQIPF